MDATTAAAHEAPSPQSPAASDKTAIGTSVDNVTHRDCDTLLEPMLGLALFSTQMGTRSQRPAPVPSDAPPIARSDPFQAVVDTALYWRKKHYRASLAIFPYIGWKIEDLWDAEDIHIHTHNHCRDVLDFMSLDNLSAARRYAREWAQYNREHLIKTLGRDTGDLGDLIDPASHWSLLDKVFVNGESNGWPRQFLWHVAHIMRTEILEERAKEQLAAAPPAVQQPLPALTETGRADSFTTRAPLRPSLAYVEQLPAPFVPPNLPNNQPVALPRATGGRRPPSYGPPPPGPHYVPHIGHVMAGQPPNAMGPPLVSEEVVRNPRTRPYNHNMSGSMYGENLPHMAQGAYLLRSSSVAMQLPHFNTAPMAMGPGATPPPHHLMQPHGCPQGPQGFQGYQSTSPSMFPAQPYHPGSGRPGPQNQAYMTSPQMGPSYIHQGPNDRGPRGVSFGDMTNMPYNVNNGPAHNADPRRSGRHNSSYGSGGHALYDPYNGTRPGFNDPNTGRKPSRGGFMDQSGRTRKPSATDNRPRTGSYGSTWVDTPSNGNGNRYPKGRTMDDPTIINDSQRGCHTKWIGPENHIVNELFVSDLPESIQEEEIKNMFVREINITPVRVSFGKQQSAAPRQHAFVLFTTASEAKLGLRLGDAGLKIRGVTVRITVPRRFYQKSDDYLNYYEAQKPDTKPAEERDIRGFTQSSSHKAETVATDAKTQTTELQYSPQDVRSDLQKTGVISSDADVVSPTRQSSPESKATTLREEPVQSEHSSDDVEAALGLESADMSKDEPEVQYDVRGTREEQQSFVLATSRGTYIVGKLSESQNIVQPTIDDANAIVKESPSHSSAEEQSATGHAHVETRTKAPFETIEANHDGDEKVSMAVKTAGTANDDDVQAKHIFTSTDGEDNNTPEADMKSATVQESGSDDEADHDVSFQSAQEVVDGTEPTAVAEAGSPTTNHGSDIGTAAAVESSIEEKNSHPQPTATDENSQPSSVQIAQTSSSPASTVVAMDSEDKHDTAMAKGTEIPTTTISKPSAAAMKSQGPQQTPSLNPFAKPSKSQRKKDKQQQKKKGLQTAKAKVGEASTATGSSSSAPSTNTQPNVPVTSGTLPSSDQSQTPAPPTPSDAQVPQGTNVAKGKGKAKADAAATDNLDNKTPVVEGKGKEATSGGQPGDDSEDITDETGLVTHEAKADQNAVTPERQNSSNALASTSGVHSTENNGAATTHILPLATASTGGSVKSDDAPTAPTASTAPKMKKTVPAVPNLKLNAGSAFTCEPDAKSAASSDTLHPIGSAAQLSPSPTAEDFHTPLQTPAATSATQELVAPLKKKKNKKKKKKTAALVSTDAATASAPVGESISSRAASTTLNNNSDGSTEFDYSADPFGGQMSHVDAIRKAVKDPTTYYNRTNRDLAGQAPNTELVSISTAVDNRNSPAKANKKSNEIKDDPATRAQDWRQIEAFLKQNPIFD